MNTPLVEGKLTFRDRLAVITRRTQQKPTRRRKPTQLRAQTTVAAMLEAVVRLLKQGGISAITTNRIAEKAGVSIGSVYQYFPNKQAIFIALHEQHIREVDRVMYAKIDENVDEPLDRLISSLIDGMIEIHAADPALSVLLDSEVPHRADGSREFSVRLHRKFRAALAPHARTLGGQTKLDSRAFLLGNMVEALGHALVLRRPPGLSLRSARVEASRAILAALKCTSVLAPEEAIRPGLRRTAGS